MPHLSGSHYHQVPIKWQCTESVFELFMNRHIYKANRQLLIPESLHLIPESLHYNLSQDNLIILHNTNSYSSSGTDWFLARDICFLYYILLLDRDNVSDNEQKVKVLYQVQILSAARKQDLSFDLALLAKKQNETRTSKLSWLF